MSIPDFRKLEQWPIAPSNEKGVLEWARKLMMKLTSEKADIYNVFTQGYDSTILYSPSYSNILKIIISGDCTIDVKPGRIGPVWIILQNDVGAGHVITFGTGFTAAGTLTGTTNKTAVLEFISDGGTFWEVSRTTNL